MNGYEFAFYSTCVICGAALTAWLWYLCAKSEPVDNKYQKYVDSYINRDVWFRYTTKPVGDKEKDNE